ncbi:hypothetical protein DTO10_08465 [Peribacillus butanolivorans]|uniref:Uncharacterized protein n=1 Tax=Peribacillus butanolivorans TaxID=421767 RepID=A0ABM6XJ56_9BACI|nr:hypothetical protein DTO10_08465 [Peribacillus butanolivorans]
MIEWVSFQEYKKGLILLFNRKKLRIEQLAITSKGKILKSYYAVRIPLFKVLLSMVIFYIFVWFLHRKSNNDRALAHFFS